MARQVLRGEQPADVEEYDEEDEEWVIDYATLFELGKEAVKRKGKELGFSCGNNMGMSEALGENAGEFWKNWSIVTGIPVPPDAEDRSSFSCAC